MAEQEKRLSPLSVLGDGLLLLCALPGLTACFLSLYGRTGISPALMEPLDWAAAQGDQLLLLAALFALLSLCAWSLPRFRWAAAGGLAALWGLTLWGSWRAVSAGAVLTVQAVAGLFASRVTWGRTLPYDSGLLPQAQREAVWLFLILTLALLALVLGWAVACARRWWIVAVITLPPLLPGLLADLYPSWPAFLALCACWCAMLMASLCRWAAPSARGRLTLAALGASALVLIAITLIFPREGYTRPPWALKAQEDLANLANRAADWLPRWENGPFRTTVTFVGSAEEADLTRAGPLDYSGRTVLRVTSDYEGRLYLRGSSLAVYEDGVWKALPEGTYEEYCPAGEHAPVPLYFPAMQEQDSPTYTVTVNNVGAVGACVYAPYFPTPQVAEDTGALPVEDSYLARKQGQWEHTLSFVDRTPPDYAVPGNGGYVALTGSGPSEGQIAAGRYAEYAYSHYLDVPEELRGELEELIRMAWSAGALGDRYLSAPIFSEGDVPKYAGQLADFLSTFCTYDQSAPAAPEGTDPVLYFLNESQRGYCMHYASAATLLLRTMGIPARYVSGFTAVAQPGRQVDVPDRAAHAWVEVWLDGFGWYPVEVTPAAAFEQLARPGGDNPDPLASPDATPTPQPTDNPGETPAPSQGPGGPAGPGEGEDDPAQGPWAALLAVGKGLAALAGLWGLLWLIQFALKRHRTQRLADPDRNRAGLYAYRCLERMERWGGRIDPQGLELAEKAKYSGHTLTEEELAGLTRLVARERTRLAAGLVWWRRLPFRYLWGMPSPPVFDRDL